ncbi:HEAT repeat domain-containing protein [Occallatibacter riparius]|uniref:HEAT repeat domain-containing protein n=1 Tax=Occallatibacter riparius TaxID=1002689 RepID=A0A9J7BWC5_9BACT|nr:hypothetical protein [Occallatibacter riparius]UWZ86809.1 hypothetical protein MOP44_12870 [Occallatibacter riparius]
MISTILRSIAIAAATTIMVAAAAPQAGPGDQSRWSLEFRVRMEQSSTPPIDVHIAGEWISTISAVYPGRYEAQLRLDNVHCIGDAVQKAPAAAVAELEARLSRPFWATYRSDGGLIEIHFYRDSTPSDRNLLLMMASELQLVRPPDSRSSWTSEERDGAGEYSALYLVPQPDRILKRKLKYTHTDGVAGAPTDAVHVAVDQSDISFSLNPDRNVAGIDGTDRIRFDLSTNQAQQLAAVTEFHLGNLRTTHVPELIGSLERARPQLSSSAIVTQRPDAARVRAEADDRLLDGYATDALLAAAFTKDGGTAASPDRLTALFRRRPEAARAAASLLQSKGRNRVITNALGASGSSSAVEVLSALAHDTSLPQDLRVDAVVAFVQMQHPPLKAMSVLQDLMQDPNPAVRSAARMMSGALARAGRPEHEAEADAIDVLLIALYSGARDTGEKSELLGALGNSVGPAVIPVIEEALSDERVSIRGAAARALRLAPGIKTDRLLAAAITSDQDAAVRADAIFAVRFRHPLTEQLADALLQAASTDKVEYVRSDALAVLRLNPTASARIPETLERIAKLDTAPGIRRQAREALTSLSLTAANHR